MNGIIVQFWATFVLSITVFLGGFAISWPSYTIPFLLKPSSPLGRAITQHEANLIGSLPMLGFFIPTFFSAYLSDTLGRKKAKIISVLCFVLSWALIATAKSVLLIYIGRMVIGIGMGMDMIIAYTFVSEYTQDSMRGTMVSVLSLLYTAGGLASYIAGWFCSYDVINYMNLTVSITSVVLVSLLKETPPFLLGQKREKDALNSLKFYRGASHATAAIIDELAYLKQLTPKYGKTGNNAIEEGTKNEKEKLQELEGQTEELSAFQTICKTKSILRALVIIMVQINLMVFMGTVAVSVFAGQMFADASPDLSSDMCAVMLATAVMVGSMLSMVCSDLVPRRVLMISTSAFCTVSLVVLCSMLRWHWAHKWAIPIVILLYSCVFQIGVANVPFIQLAESFPTKVKSLVNTIVSSTMGIANFIVIVTFEPLVAQFGLDVTFLVYAGVTALATIISYFFMKETRKVTLKEIMDMYEEGWLYKRKLK